MKRYHNKNHQGINEKPIKSIKMQLKKTTKNQQIMVYINRGIFTKN